MKFRTDFVTNSSSISFITVTIDLADGKAFTLDYLTGGDLSHYTILEREEKNVLDIDTVEKFASLLADPPGRYVQDDESYYDKILDNVKEMSEVGKVTVFFEKRAFYIDNEDDEDFTADFLCKNEYDFLRRSVTTCETGYDYQKSFSLLEKIRTDKKYRFFSAFDDKTGAYLRSGIILDGKDSGIDPFMASFPHLVDVGIMGHCAHGKSGLCQSAGIGCYQSGAVVERPNMELEDFAKIVRQCAGKVDQFALGGRGDPDMHEDFGAILKLCRDHNIVPNLTTSGFGLTEQAAELCKDYCGAVAVSWYRSKYTEKAIQTLLKAGVKTNIHYVLSGNTVDEAVDRLERNSFPEGVNAVIFLLHKPVGLGAHEKMLDYSNLSDSRNPKVKRFFELLDRGNLPFKVGIDSCIAPGVVNHCKNIMFASIDTCEGGRFSCYISADMMMMPCSFDQEWKYAVSLRNHSMEDAWNSDAFSDFRRILRNSCMTCNERDCCLGGCPLIPEIVFCEREERSDVKRKTLNYNGKEYLLEYVLTANGRKYYIFMRNRYHRDMVFARLINGEYIRVSDEKTRNLIARAFDNEYFSRTWNVNVL